MYEQKYNPPFVVHDNVTNSPYNHQRIISELTVELGVLYYHKQTISLIPLPETSLDEGPGYPVPDVILFDEKAEQTRSYPHEHTVVATAQTLQRFADGLVMIKRMLTLQS